MSLFNLDVILLGFYIFFTHNIMTVYNSERGEKWVRGTLNESESFRYIYDYPYKSCREEGEGNMAYVQMIRVFLSNGPHMDIDLKKQDSNNYYKDLIERVTMDCNGKPLCDSSQNGVSKNTSSQQVFKYKTIDVLFSCIQIHTVNQFNISLDFHFKPEQIKSDSKFYLVLRLHENSSLHRHCIINGNQANVSLTVLHVDFGANSECKHGRSNSVHLCDRNMSLVSRDNESCDYKWLPSSTFKIIECQAKKLEIDIHLSSGFVWIELTASKVFKLNCSGPKHSNNAKTPMPTSHQSHSTTTKTVVTKANESTTIINEHEANPPEYLYTIVIPVMVAVLVLLIVIGSFVFCVCRRDSRFQVWKRNRRESAISNREDAVYNNASTDEILDPTYNTVDAPGGPGTIKGISPGHNADDDYAFISQVDKASNSQPQVTSVAHKKPGKPMKTPTSSEPSFKVKKQVAEAPDDDLGVTYATVNKVKKVENTESRGAIAADAVVPTLTEAGGEYSHLAQFKKKNYENVYNC